MNSLKWGIPIATPAETTTNTIRHKFGIHICRWSFERVLSNRDFVSKSLFVSYDVTSLYSTSSFMELSRSIRCSDPIDKDSHGATAYELGDDFIKDNGIDVGCDGSEGNNRDSVNSITGRSWMLNENKSPTTRETWQKKKKQLEPEIWNHTTTGSIRNVYLNFSVSNTEVQRRTRNKNPGQTYFDQYRYPIVG